MCVCRVTKPCVLLVEDNPVSARMIERFMEKAGYAIAAVVAKGEDAVARVGFSKPDLILMDVQLAGAMDGIEAARRIWSQFHIPIVYLTGSSDDETVARAACTGAYGYLHKPIQERELSSAVHLALNKYQMDCVVKEKEQWLETTLRCIADAVIAADSAGCVMLVNPAAEALTGWKQEQAVGRDLLEVFHVLERGTRLPAECAVVEVIRNGSASATGLTRILVARDGAETMVEETAAPIVNHVGNIVGVVLVFRVGNGS